MKRIDMIVFGLCVIACVLALACIIQIHRYNSVQEESPDITQTEWYRKQKRKNGGMVAFDNRIEHKSPRLIVTNTGAYSIDFRKMPEPTNQIFYGEP